MRNEVGSNTLFYFSFFSKLICIGGHSPSTQKNSWYVMQDIFLFKFLRSLGHFFQRSFSLSRGLGWGKLRWHKTE